MKSFTDYDAWLFHNGEDTRAYEKMGAHLTTENGQDGTRFVVWAPHAQQVSVITSRNNWDPLAAPMQKTSEEVWELFIPGMQKYDSYKYVIVGADGVSRYKSDPYAFASELRPSTGSVVWTPDSYEWHDQAYMDAVDPNTVRSRPMSIYEVHIGSWKKDYRLNKDGFYNYGRAADELAEYVNYMGFTHVELIGICEHPFDGSWGYQVSGYFCPTSRYGNPDDFKYFVDRMHQAGIGVILDWVPAHFPKDSHCMEMFDGTPLYESADPLLAEYPEWGTKAFDYSKPQVRSFMMSSAFYWINEFHIDALRVDAVAAMLDTNFSRAEWRPNKYGGTENLESVEFLRHLNGELRYRTKGYMIAEDSSMRWGITADTSNGGLGFMFKWNMGWMNDTLKYMKKDPIYRKYHHGELTHTADYVYDEYFVNVLSHDEVVHLKNSMVGKMPGSMGDKFAGLKTLYSYQWLHPGKQLLFMGQEFAQEREWSEERDIDWGCAEDVWHRDVMECVRKLNALYKKYPCLYSESQNPTCFEWVNRDDASRSTISFLRRNPWNWDGALLCIINFTPVYIGDYSCGVPIDCSLQRVFSTYDSLPGGGERSEEVPPQHTWQGHCDHYDFGMTYNLRPFECAVFELK